VAPITLSNTQMICDTPAKAASRVPVEVTTDGGRTYSQNHVAYLYSGLEVVTSISPSKGPDQGSTMVRVSGSGFQNFASLSCMFGVTKVSARWFSSDAVECTAPPKNAGLEVSVRVANNGFDFSTTYGVFLMTARESITDVKPTISPITGGTVISIIGTAFTRSHSLFCRFGSKDSAARYYTSTFLTCITPYHPSGTVKFDVSNNHIDFTTSGVQVQFKELVIITSISPLNGPEEGRTQVDVYGSNFYGPSSDIRCKFGDTVVDGVTFVSTTHVRCPTPRMSGSRTVSVQLAMTSGDFSDTAQVFRYDPPMAVTGVTPSIGTRFGGTQVTVFGENFMNSANLRCRFTHRVGSVTSAARWLSSTLVVCKFPGHAGSESGESAVAISANAVDYTLSKVIFLSSSPPIVTSIHPTVGGADGGSIVQVQGKHFMENSDLSCMFGSARVTAKFVSDTQIECISPIASPADMQLDVTNNGQEISTSGVHYLFTPPPKVFELSPSTGPMVGSSVINVTGFHLVNWEPFNPTLKCKFGDAVTDGSFVSSTFMHCPTPPSTEGSVFLEISVNGVDYTSNFVPFQFTGLPSVKEMYPSFGPLAGGTAVTLIGSGFPASGRALCRLGEATAGLKTMSPFEARCETPANREMGSYPMEYSFDGRTFLKSGFRFLFFDAPRVVSLTPTLGPDSGGTTITFVLSQSIQAEDGVVCRFGDVQITPSKFEGTRITCNSPAQAAGKVWVSLSASSTILGEASVFVFYAREHVSAVAPSMGDVGGGLVLSVVGWNFVNLGTSQRSGVSCKFGDAISSIGTVISSSLVTCVTPQNKEGVVELEVSNNGINFSADRVNFRYTPPVEIFSASPSIGSAAGGTEIRVEGMNFEADMRCNFGGEMIVSDVRSSTYSLCVTPERDPGIVSLRLSNNGIELSTSGVDLRFTSRWPLSISFLRWAWFLVAHQ